MAVLALGAGPQAALAQDADNFVIVCGYDHSAPDDPIVFPGLAGASHLHDFFGAVGVRHDTVNADLRAPATATLCGNAADKAAYWAPSLYVNGARHRPDHVKAYYRRDGRPVLAMKPFPDNLRIVAGNATATTQAERQGLSYWRCKNPDHTEFEVILPPLDCPGNKLLVMSVLFPSCSNGLDDSTDHKSHMAYPQNGICPVTHLDNVPRIELHVHFRTGGGPDAILSSGGGSVFSAHADFMNGWPPGALQQEMDRCYGQNQCGVAEFPGFRYVTPTDENVDGRDDNTDELLDQPPVAPSFTQSASVSGSPRLAQQLTAVAVAEGDPDPSLSYQWQRCAPACQNIANATARNYTVGALDVNKDLRVIVQASNSAGTATSTSPKVHATL